MLIDLFTRMHEQALQRQDYALAMARGEKDTRPLKDLTSLLTQFAPEAVDSPAAPNAYLIEIDKRGQ